jgi:hypothetical protein
MYFAKVPVGAVEHKTVNHLAKEYARYEDGFCVTTNTVESAFSLLKRGIMGTWHEVSAKHLPAYLDEMVSASIAGRRRPCFWIPCAI